MPVAPLVLLLLLPPPGAVGSTGDWTDVDVPCAEVSVTVADGVAVLVSVIVESTGSASDVAVPEIVAVAVSVVCPVAVL